MRVLNTDIRATTDEQGIAELRFAENINELILVSLESEEYIESTQTCFAKQYQDRNNPYTILTQLANFAITNLTMYQEQTQDNTTKQIPIYTAQPYITNNQAQSNNTPISSNTQTHTTNTTDSQHLISLQAHIQTLQGGKMSAIQWGYYIKQSNENLKSKITIKDLKPFTFISQNTYNTKVSFDINAKFTYTITENNTQKEITDYLKDNQQLIIFAYRKSPAYTTSYGTPHTILTISQYPILKLTSKMLTILYAHTNATYTLTHPCDTHYLSENLKSEKIYTLELRESNLYIKDKESNKDIALMLTKEIPNIQEKTILLDSKDLQNLQTTLGLHTHRDIREVYVEVEKPYYIDSEGYLQGLNIVKYPITRLESSLVNGFTPKAIVLHGTGSTTAKSALATWSNPNNARVGTHFLIDTDGTIYQCASLHKYTQHVGDIRSKVELEKTWNAKEKVLIDNIWKEKTSYVARKIKVSNYEKTKSYPNRYPISSDSIGIEVVGKYDDKTKRYPNATTKQLESLEQLVIVLLELFNISKTDMYAHAKIAYKDENSAEGVYLLEYLRNKL